MMAIDRGKEAGKPIFATCNRKNAFQCAIAVRQERKKLIRHNIQLPTG